MDINKYLTGEPPTISKQDWDEAQAYLIELHDIMRAKIDNRLDEERKRLESNGEFVLANSYAFVVARAFSPRSEQKPLDANGALKGTVFNSGFGV